MKTTRRTFLKGSAAFATAVAAPAFIHSGQVSAQAPRYELIDLVTFTESVKLGGNTFFGTLFAINASGSVAGYLVSDGLSRPAIWTLDGQVTILDAGEFGGLARALNTAGDAVGSLFNLSESDELGLLPAAWLNGAFVDMPVPADFQSPDPEGRVTGGVNAINDAGVMTGWIGQDAFRWLDDVCELLPVERSAAAPNSSRGWVVSPSGTIGGTLAETNEVFIWKRDDTVQTFGLPLFPNGSSQTNPFMTVIHLSDDDELLLQVSEYRSDRKESDRMAVQYRSGIAEVLPLVGNGAMTQINGVNDSGVVVGNQAVAETSGAGVVWLNDQLYDLNDQIGTASGLRIQNATDINADGDIVASAIDASNTRHGVVLRPV